MAGSNFFTKVDFNENVKSCLTDIEIEVGFGELIKFGSFVGDVPTEPEKYWDGCLLIKEDAQDEANLYENRGTIEAPDFQPVGAEDLYATLGDNADGTYTFNNGIDLPVIVNTNAGSNPYNNLSSGLTATTVQEAIDELSALGSPVVTQVVATGNVVATHDDQQGNVVDILETVTGLALNANTLTYTKEDGTTDDIDLAIYLDDTNLARLVSGTLDGAGIATFVRDDATSFTVDFSPLFDDTNLARITSAALVGTDLVLTRDDATTVQADLSTLLDDTNLPFIQSGAVVGTDLILTRNDASTITIDVTSLIQAPETVTTLSDNTNGTYTYTSEDATVTNIDANAYDTVGLVDTSIELTKKDGTVDSVDLSPILLDTVSVMTSSNTGHVIASHDNGQGLVVDVQETVTGLNLAANILTYTKEDGTTDNIDLSLYLDDTNLARIISGAVVGTDLILTRDDATTVVIDVTSLTGGAVTTASNGLNIDGVSGDVQLGGTLVEDTTIDGNAGTYSLTANDLSTFLIQGTTGEIVGQTGLTLRSQAQNTTVEGGQNIVLISNNFGLNNANSVLNSPAKPSGTIYSLAADDILRIKP